MATWYIYRDKSSACWQRVISYDECGYFTGQYFLSGGISDYEQGDYWPCTTRSVLESWSKVPGSGFNVLQYISEDELVRLILTNFATVNEDYPHG